jgi:hypothetical protein
MGRPRRAGARRAPGRGRREVAPGRTGQLAAAAEPGSGLRCRKRAPHRVVRRGPPAAAGRGGNLGFERQKTDGAALSGMSSARPSGEHPTRDERDEAESDGCLDDARRPSNEGSRDDKDHSNGRPDASWPPVFFSGSPAAPPPSFAHQETAGAVFFWESTSGGGLPRRFYGCQARASVPDGEGEEAREAETKTQRDAERRERRERKRREIRP